MSSSGNKETGENSGGSGHAWRWWATERRSGRSQHAHVSLNPEDEGSGDGGIHTGHRGGVEHGERPDARHMLGPRQPRRQEERGTQLHQ